MSQQITLEIPDNTYESLRAEADAIGSAPAELAATVIQQKYGSAQEVATRRKPLTESEKQAARERFRRMIGAVHLGYPLGADNESIDADLAREYADTHEET